MRDWNVIVTVRGPEFDKARRFLADFGLVHHTGLYNVLVMKVSDLCGFLGAVQRRLQECAEFRSCIGRVTPVKRTFGFETPEEFEALARQAALAFERELAGKSFHVRFHRRGFKGQLSSPDEERFLDGTLLEALRTAGTPGRITFDDPDAVLCVETIGNRAGFSLWTRDEINRYPFLRPD